MSLDESFEAAIARELQEELNMEVDGAIQEIAAIIEGSLTIHFLELSWIGRLELMEHQEYKWCSTKELLELPLCPIDEQFFTEVLDAMYRN